MKRIVIVGAGNWSRAMHLPVLRALQARGLARYVAVCDLDPQKAGTCADDLDAQPFTDFDAMLTQLRPDGVALLTAGAATAELIERCIERGLPFLAEKPPAPDAARHRRLIERAGSLPHIVAYNRRHAPYMRQALAWIEGVPLQAVFCDFSRYNRHDTDFAATFMHGVDAVQFLAGAEFDALRMETAQTGGARNCYIGGWTASGIRLELRITPATGSAREHYTLISSERSVAVAFPQPPMIDLPGYVELHERNRVVQRKTAADFGLAADDLAGLGGIAGEHELFVEMLEGRAPACSTLKTSLSAQIVCDAWEDMIAVAGRQAREFSINAPDHGSQSGRAHAGMVGGTGPGRTHLEFQRNS